MKIQKFCWLILATITLVWLTGCDKLPINTPRNTVSPFYCNFELGNFEGWYKNYSEDSISFSVVSDIVPRHGTRCAKFTIRPGDIVTFGNRSEIYRPNTAFWGTETYYSWSFLIPSDYKDCSGTDWEVIGQFHDLPDFVAGENYENFPPTHPPVSLVHYKGNMTLTVNTPNNSPYSVSTVPVEKGVWHDVVLRIYWSPNKDGYIEAWFDGQHLTKFNGKDFKFYRSNMNNKTGNYLKIGIYRSKNIKTINTVYFDEVKIGNSYTEVAP